MTSGCSVDKLHCLQFGECCQAQAQTCTQTGACVCSSAAELDELQYEPVKVATLKEHDRLAALHCQLFGHAGQSSMEFVSQASISKSTFCNATSECFYMDVGVALSGPVFFCTVLTGAGDIGCMKTHCRKGQEV